ncbi:MAG TPA: hypothetical protein ENG44_01510 [Desulfurococcaceae archaeon]|nr:hypothetical protein [Desulfurococcaceae archaeon]
MDTNKNLLWDPYFELLSFLIASARGLIDEPQMYGPLRLLDAAVKLINTMEKEGRLTDELREIRQLILEKSDLVIRDEKAFIEFLDELSLKLARIIKNNLPSSKEVK